MGSNALPCDGHARWIILLDTLHHSADLQYKVRCFAGPGASIQTFQGCDLRAKIKHFRHSLMKLFSLHQTILLNIRHVTPRNAASFAVGRSTNCINSRSYTELANQFVSEVAGLRGFVPSSMNHLGPWAGL